MAAVKNDQLCQLNVLCPTCSHVVDNSKILQRHDRGTDEEEIFAYFPTFSEVELSSNAGCHLCSLIYQAAILWQPSEVEDHYNVTINLKIRIRFCEPEVPSWSANPEPSTGWQSHCMLDIRSDLEEQYLLTELSLMVLRNSPLDLDGREASDHLSMKAPHESRLTFNTGSQLNMELANQWIATCKKQHARCRFEAKDTALPTRLIYLTPKNTARLVISKNLQHVPEYVTLSYCWGGRSSLVLLKSNLGLFMEEIDVEKVPLTISHAFDIARRMGYSYIWVDSLCIIQDSRSDWAEEAPNMGGIYRNAAFTISATSAKHSDEGCFFDRNPLRFTPLLVSGTVDEGIFIYFATCTYKPSDSVSDWVDDGLWAGRGWVLQERLLSKRNLHFTSEGLVWTCLENIAFESAPEGQSGSTERHWDLRQLLHPVPATNSSLVPPSPDTLRSEVLQAPALRIKSLDKANFFNAWTGLTYVYSGCLLTRPTDRLPALLGLVRELQRATGLKIVEGMWIDDYLLPHLLLWRTLHMPNGLFSPPPKRAASFSWASIDSRVHHDNTIKAEILVKNLRVKPAMSNSNEFAQLKIEGKIYDCSFNQISSIGVSNAVIGGCLLGYTPDTNEVFEPTSQVALLLILNNKSDGYKADSYTSAASITKWANWIDRDDIPSTCGLVLVSTTKDNYRRIGQFAVGGLRGSPTSGYDWDKGFELLRGFETAKEKEILIV